MTYGPFDGRYFSSKIAFDKFVSRKIIHHDHRVKHGTIPKEFKSKLLAEALFRHHPRFKGESYSEQFGFILNKRLEKNSKRIFYKLCVNIKGVWCPFSYKGILAKNTWKDVVSMQLKARWNLVREPIYRKLSKKNDKKCDECKDAIGVDVDHISPQHSEIIQECIDYAESLESFDPDELMEEYCKKSWRNYEELLKDIYEKYDKITMQGKYQLLCKDCHPLITTRRKIC